MDVGIEVKIVGCIDMGLEIGVRVMGVVVRRRRDGRRGMNRGIFITSPIWMV